MYQRITLSLLLGVAAASSFPVAAQEITTVTWNSGLTGAQQWNVNGNWSPATFPNSGEHGATIAVGSDLTLDLGPSTISVAALSLNGTSATTDINITAATPGARLEFRNDDDNTFFDPPEADADHYLNHEGVNHGRVYVTSNGAAGSTNTINAPIRLANNGFLEGVDFFGSQSITLSGDIDIAGTTTDDVGALRSYLAPGAKLHITGNISLTDIDNTTARELRLNNYFTTDRADVPHGLIEVSGVISGLGDLVAGWTYDLDGTEDGTDDMQYDPGDSPGLPLGTVILSGANTFTGDARIARGNLVLGHNSALGFDNTFSPLGADGESKTVGFNIISTSDDRVISNNVDMTNWLTVRGATGIPGLEDVGDHSIEFTGEVIGNSTRGWINLLPDGKTLALSGPQYPLQGDDTTDTDRIYTVDGSGTTIISGGILNRHPVNNGMTTISRGHFRVRSNSVVYVDWDGVQGTIPNPDYDPNDPNETDPPTIPNPEDRPSDYSGFTWMEGGNLHFAQNEDLGTGAILSGAGAVGIDAGVIANSTFLAKFNNSSNPNWTPPTAVPFFATFNTGVAERPIFTRYSSGGLMLGTVGTDEYTQDLNFTTGDLARAANMTLAAEEGGSTYTGTITPSSSILINPNTYQLGGGKGTLTLPNANQLTGARNLLVTNGGEVFLDDTNNYSGTTRIQVKYRDSFEDYAEAGTSDPDNDADYVETQLATKISSTLTVSHLANGGADSSIGNSSNAATNLIIQGSTFQYVGGGTSTDRLFTVGTAGASLDASGSGAVNFNNTGAVAIDIAEDRIGLLATAVKGTENNEIFSIPSTPAFSAFFTDDLVLGMRVSDAEGDFNDDDSGVVITSIPAREVVRVGEIDLEADNEDFTDGTIPWNGHAVGGAPRTIQFGPAPARTLTLAGSNTGDNTLAPLLANAGDIVEATPDEVEDGYGTVGITKTDAGKWVLTNANTYTGPTNVDEGTLLVNGNQSAATGLTTVSAGGILGGTGTIGGDVIFDAGADFTAAFGGGTIDSLSVLGDVNLLSLDNTLTVTGVGVGTSWTLLTYAGTLSGEFELSPGYEVDYGSGFNSEITISLAPPENPIGDYNNNGVVDAADYAVWRNSLGGSPSALFNRDPNNTSPTVNQDDYLAWRAHFGQSGSGSGAGFGGAVPEPTALLLTIVAVAGGTLVGRRRV